jgi:hypothetical protein
MSGVPSSGPRPTLAALRAWLVSDIPPRPGSPSEARALAAEAASQGLAGLLSGALEPAEWPLEIRQGLEATRRALLFRGVQQLDALASAVDRLAREGLRALPLKGAALAEDLYPSIADRPMCDVDLLALDDYDASRRVLEAAGLRAVDVSDHAVALVAGGGVVLELHRSVTSCPGLFTAELEPLWARSREGRGQARRIPSAEDLLVQLGLHAAFQHGLVLRLVQYLDFRRLLERPLDAARVAAIAHETGAEIALAAALAAAAVLAGAAVPDPLRRALAPLPEQDRRWLQRWLSDPERSLAPREAPLARLRWMAARGRRRGLVRGTLLVRHAGGPVRRALGLAARFGGPSLRQLLPAVRRPSG